jgi:hypothetical protein
MLRNHRSHTPLARRRPYCLGHRGHRGHRGRCGCRGRRSLGLLSIWAIQRDNGGCPGTIDSDTCSGVAQPAWAFSHVLEPFTS